MATRPKLCARHIKQRWRQECLELSADNSMSKRSVTIHHVVHPDLGITIRPLLYHVNNIFWEFSLPNMEVFEVINDSVSTKRNSPS